MDYSALEVLYKKISLKHTKVVEKDNINEISRGDPCYCFSLVKSMNIKGGRLEGHVFKSEMVKSKGSRIKSHRFYSTSVPYLTSACLGFLMVKIKIMKVSIPSGCWEVKKDHRRKVLSAVFGKLSTVTVVI